MRIRAPGIAPPTGSRRKVKRQEYDDWYDAHAWQLSRDKIWNMSGTSRT
jgi:hypothetical protein